ncbi:MAG: 30S ribosomal protein S17 [Candidatus Aenigmarchaeota archaeon]|nr:30S ribosomal protein S17 [Candidatus Aenigmarchaeota archaeon]
MRKKKKLDIGLDVKKPKGDCNSDKCPWHGHLKIRGRVLQGKVVSDKGSDTAVVEWNYYNYIPKYERYERRKTRMPVHSPTCIGARTGDIVTIGECRPLSKTKRFVIIEKRNIQGV